MNIETHPWPSFVPEGARALFLGTFPPGEHRWAMDFFYPNRTNDFWRVMGMIYFDDADALYDRCARAYRLPLIKRMLSEHGIALGDTGYRIRRLRGNASDKYLEIVEPVDLQSLLTSMPLCSAIASTGAKAAAVLAQLTGTKMPETGTFTLWERTAGNMVQLWRLPSTSRAYPLPPQQKAVHYRNFLIAAGCVGKL